MHITVTFRHMEATDALKAYAEDKSDHFTKYLKEPVEIHWVLSVEKDRQFAEATVNAGGVSVNAKHEDDNMYAAIDSVSSKVKSQVQKHKEKTKNHKFKEDESTSVKFQSEE